MQDAIVPPGTMKLLELMQRSESEIVANSILA